ncbi:Alpha 1,3 fucosyltransferase [Mortierella claussenii]|nr:Alpha 1,3 fucosyltransferase [Mortierella claussenii]
MSQEPALVPSQKQYVILWWTKWFDEDRYEGQVIDQCGLPYTCKSTLDRTQYDNSNLIVFHDWHPKDLPPKEDAINNKKAWFTYHWDSDFIFSYFTAGSTHPGAFINLVTRPPLHTLASKIQFRKTGFHPLDNRPLAPIAWVVSNCKAISGRHYMVNQLLKYINIDIYGHCIRNRAWPQTPTSDGGMKDMDIVELISHYKFYLAIENGNCEDYVTEKLEQTFAAGAVPVVDGPEDYSRFMPAHKSLIRYDDYGSPQRLAEYLTELDQDDHQYQEYLSFRTARSPDNTDAVGNILVNSPETFNRNYRKQLLPWFVDNWDIDTSGPANKTTTDWLSEEGSTRTSRAKYNMQWGPDFHGGACAMCRVAHDLAEGIMTIDPDKRLKIDTTCRNHKFYYTSWIIAFYPFTILFLFLLAVGLTYLVVTRSGRAIVRKVLWKAKRLYAIVRARTKKGPQYYELTKEEERGLPL